MNYNCFTEIMYHARSVVLLIFVGIDFCWFSKIHSLKDIAYINSGPMILLIQYVIISITFFLSWINEIHKNWYSTNTDGTTVLNGPIDWFILLIKTYDCYLYNNNWSLISTCIYRVINQYYFNVSICTVFIAPICNLWHL